MIPKIEAAAAIETLKAEHAAELAKTNATIREMVTASHQSAIDAATTESTRLRTEHAALHAAHAKACEIHEERQARSRQEIGRLMHENSGLRARIAVLEAQLKDNSDG